MAKKSKAPAMSKGGAIAAITVLSVALAGGAAYLIYDLVVKLQSKDGDQT